MLWARRGDLVQTSGPLGYCIGKRLFDVIVASLLLILTAPVMLILAVLIWFDMRGAVLFRQTRPGLNGRPFTLLKFRTMSEAFDETGLPLPDALRMTRIGRMLRHLSLDELPQLLNVLKGDMSLVGPRPLLMEYLSLYSVEQARRHNVPPGITGWSQVNGRNAIDWEKRLAMDVWYVDHACFALDLRILLMTFAKVLGRRDVNAPGEATVSKFCGEGASKPMDEKAENE